MDKKRRPLFLEYLNDNLDYHIQTGKTTLGYDIFHIDLSAWKWRLTDHTPIIWVRNSDVESVSPKHLLQSLQDVSLERNFQRRVVLILIDGPFNVSEQHNISDFIHKFVFINENDQAQLMASRRPTGFFQDLVSKQLLVSELAPYEISAPVTGSRFFGRDYEIGKILNHPDRNFMVLGIRRIGKTSLLQELERRLTTDAHSSPAYYLDCSDFNTTYEYIQEVVRRLNPKELPRLHLQKYAFFFPNFLDRMSQKLGHKLTFLLDELDSLVITQRGHWELFKMLRASANKGSCQYILGGFGDTMRELYTLDGPFYLSADPILLKEFTKEQARKLIVTPMESLRITVQNKDEIVGTIYHETAGHPNLIQYYCKVLVESLDERGERIVSLSNLFDVYNDTNFKNHLLASFLYNTKNRERRLVYALLKTFQEDDAPKFRQADIDYALKKTGCRMPQYDIDEACNILLLVGIFHQMGQDYSFTSPVFIKILRQTYDLDYLLMKIREEEA